MSSPNGDEYDEVCPLGGAGDGVVLHAGAEAAPAALVERAVADDDVGHARGDGHRRLHDRAARRAAAVVDAGEVAQLADADVAGDLDLGVGVRGERDQPVDVGRLEPGVGDRGGDRLAGQLHLAASGVLGELGGADADDGGLAADRVPGASHAHGSVDLDGAR